MEERVKICQSGGAFFAKVCNWRAVLAPPGGNGLLAMKLTLRLKPVSSIGSFYKSLPRLTVFLS
jgi:hypothetical protein